jgi:uncharacterized MnhB-related membrane protein
MERRQDGEDRRKIERFSSPPVRLHFRQINIFIHFLTILCFCGALYNIFHGIRLGTPVEITFGVFMAVIFGMLAAALYGYSVAIQAFLTNESISNLDRAMEKQSALWFLIFVLTLIYTIVYFIFG